MKVKVKKYMFAIDDFNYCYKTDCMSICLVGGYENLKKAIWKFSQMHNYFLVIQQIPMQRKLGEWVNYVIVLGVWVGVTG